MIFIGGESQYSKWGITKDGKDVIKPHHTQYIVGINNKVYVRSCNHNDDFNYGKWATIKMRQNHDDDEFDITPEEYLNYQTKSYSEVWVYDFSNEKELEEMFKTEFELHVQSLIRNAKLKSILK